MKLRAVEIVLFGEVEGEFFTVLSPPSPWAVADMAWSNAQRDFTGDDFIHNNKSVFAAQCASRTKFLIPLASVPDLKSIVLCGENFMWGTGSVIKKRVGRLCVPIHLNTSMQFEIKFCSLSNALLANMELPKNF